MIKWQNPVAIAGMMALSLLFEAAPSHAQSIVGTASVADGDSLTVAGKRVRLFGIDAPELNQTCQKDGASWRCGEAAKAQLATLVDGQQVECFGQGVDQYGRVLAVCSVGRDELNRVMVEQGWALAYRTYSDDYVQAEQGAKADRLGIWTSTFLQPAEFRHAKRLPERRAVEAKPVALARRGAPTRMGECVIKGNRNRRGQWIYHLPGMPYYEQTRAEEIFCTEAQAQVAGYRRAIVKP